MSVQPLPIVMGEGGLKGVATIVLEQPGRPVVVLDHDLIRRLDAAITHLPPNVRALVLASASERSFVAGADLKTILEWDDEQLLRYLEYGAKTFLRLSKLPYPTVAAINGAVLGGGLELAMHCDGLVASPSASGKPYPVGLPEAGLCICPGWGGTNLLPARMDSARAIELTASGTPLNFDSAKEAGLFDEVVPEPAALREAAARWALRQPATGARSRDGSPLRWIGRGRAGPATLEALDRVRPDLPKTAAASAVVEAIDAGLLKGYAEGCRVERERLVYLRGTAEGRGAIEGFFAKGR